MIFRSLAVCCAICGMIAACGSSISRGEEPRADFIKLLVPEGRENDLGKVYLPMPRAKFERLQGSLTRKREGNFQPHLELATYQAHFDGQHLTAGEAKLRIVREGEVPAFLSWGDTNLAIRSATWDSQPPHAARWGGNPTGEIGVLVDTKADLKLAWQLTGEPRPGQPPEFNLILPPALVSRLTITAAANLRLQASEGYVWEETPQPVGEQRTWQVSLGGRERVQLKFLPYTQAPAAVPRVAWRESLAYDLSLSSLDCQATWGLDVADAPLPQLTLRGEKGTSLSEVRVGDRSLPWTLAASNNGWTAVVDLPEPFWGAGRQVLVRTLSPAKLAGKQKLPRVVLEKANWQEGDSLVRVAAPLRVEEASINAGRPLALTLDPAAGSGEQLRFQHFTRDSTPELTLGRRQNTLRIVQGTLVQIEASQMNATVQGLAETTGGNRFNLDAELPREWVIDSVATIPADALEDRVISVVSDKIQRLEMRLRQPASDTQQVRFEVRAHCASPAEGSSLGSKMLRVLSFREAETHKLVAVDILDPTLQLQLTGDALLARQAVEDLTDEEHSLLSGTGTLLFRDDERADSLVLTLERRRARFAATATVQVTAVPSHLYYRLGIRCTPEGTPPRRLLVHLPTPTTGDFEWSGSDLLGELTARRGANATPGGGEEWLLEWSRTPSGPFEISARFSRSFEATQQLPLVSLPEATSQAGLIEIHSAHAGVFTLAAAEADMLPIVPAGEETSRMWARLRYEPTQIPAVTITPALPTNGLPVALVKRVRQQSRLSLDGSGLHRLQVEVVHGGGGELSFRLPQAQLLQVLGDGEELEVEARPADGSDSHAIRLPGEHRHISLQITYRTPPQANRLFPWQAWYFFGPEFGAPVEQREWTALLPPGLKFLNPQLAPTDDLLPLPTSLAEGDEWQPTAGWSVAALPWPTQQGTRIDIIRPAALGALQLSCLLVFAGVILLCGWERRTWLLPSLAMLCGVVVLTPPGIRWAVQGLAWGVAAAILCDALRRLRSTEVTTPLLPLRSATATAVVIAIVAGIGWFQTLAQEPKPMSEPAANGVKESPPEQAKNQLWTVVVPVDNKGQPTGDYFYVDPGFHALLTRSESRDNGSELRWLLRTAEYRSHFRETPDGLELDSVQAVWGLDVLQGETRVQLPLAADEYPAFAAELDGKEVVVDWDSERKKASLLISQAGEHQLVVKFRPKPKLQPTGFEASFHVPAAPQTRLIVDAPTESRDVECIAAGQRFVRRRTEPATTFLAGAAREIRFHWSLSNQERKLPVVIGEQLCWWRLRPNAITVDAYFRLRPSDGKLTSFTVLTDPRLRWRPAAESNLKGESQLLADGTKLEWRFTLPEPLERDITVPLTFQWLGLSGIGTFRPASLELQCARLERRWSAVSAVPGYSVLGSVEIGNAETLPVGEFLTLWSEPAAAPPDTAFRVPNGDELWSVELRPTEPLPTVTEHLSLGFQRDRTRVQYVAEIKGNASRRLLHRVKVPAGIVIETVKIEEANREIPSEWTPPKQNVLSIFAEAGDERETRMLQVVGRLPAITATNAPLPRLTLLESDVEACQVELFRANDVAVGITAANGFTATADNLGVYQPQWGRRVTTLNAPATVLREQRAPGTVTLTNNQPEVAGQLRLLMERAGAGWFTRGEMQFTVKSGALDELRLEIPLEWGDVKPTADDVAFELRKLPGQPRRHLILRPRQAWTGPQTLELRGSLTTTDSGVRVPEVRVLDFDDWQRFVVLPTRFEKQRIQWALSGLENVAWPKDAVPPLNQELYRLVGSRYSAVVEDVEYDVGKPHVLLAAATVRVSERNSLAGDLAWELVPNGERSCVIVVPEQLRVLQILVDGSAAIVQAVGDGKWRVTLASHDLPQRVSVEFSASLAGGHSQQRLELPTLLGLPVERTSWVILGSATAPGLVAGERGLAVEAVHVLTAALEAQASALKLAGGTELTNESPEFAADWFAPRLANWQQTKRNLSRYLERGRVPAELSTRIKAAEGMWDEAASVFSSADEAGTATGSLGSPLAPLRFAVLSNGWMSHQTLVLSPPVTATSFGGWWWGGLLCVCGAIGLWGLRQNWFAIPAEMSPAVMLSVGGLVALLSIQPTWLGLLLLAMAAVWQVAQRKSSLRRNSAR